MGKRARAMQRAYGLRKQAQQSRAEFAAELGVTLGDQFTEQSTKVEGLVSKLTAGGNGGDVQG